MTKRCPIMSKQNESHSKIYCFEKECAFWDEEMRMCCIKSAMIAVAAKPSGGFNPPTFDYAIFPPVSTGPAVIPGSSGEPYEYPYTVTCDLGEIVQ